VTYAERHERSDCIKLALVDVSSQRVAHLVLFEVSADVQCIKHLTHEIDDSCLGLVLSPCLVVLVDDS
jgi:hypothetical protein